MKALVLLGHGAALAKAQATAQACSLAHTTLELPTADRYTFDLGELFARFPAAQTEVFVALDERAVNYARHKLLAEVRLAGYRTINLISPQTIIADGVELMGNVYIGPGCNLAPRSRIGAGSWLDRQIIVEADVRVGSSVTLHAGVQLGQGAQIGQGSTLGSGSVAPRQARIGRRCEWLLHSVLPDVLPDRCFYDSLMPDGARILY
ncbi:MULTISPECIES: acetyltransferase [Xanthomonas]|uniref:Acetyltransferase n=1 Tax=Xanthomonas phaseoli pv. dieffenbachiae TaxID=92828 RepID=A0A1V9HBT5_9XANT|nr:acetyltransferase [Xanthomonas phaseoli]MBO9767931.1 acetyltransferase [Xanthomonas phaseoli pv. dieffenbachiae]MBO9776573.1 acetyltransferase [Xanthomonas phaseoli pv. dieffenbachiae]MBO9782059.1 acetyltransferase [Xanthomonas phaseoli pv. dieffenbachiae]MBO9789833.1 acetyltransferase [Xanthomonas phaseoli pv. dieffenbachiae]MBO9796172.1 acetyltransferase [Xanthomonas phaseoli pv. dieffenbachiae]